MNRLTPWTTVLLDKLIATQPVKKFPAFYGTRRFITVFTPARHWSLPWARCITSTPFQPTSLRSVLILSSHLRLDFPSGLFLLGFPTEIFYPFLSPHACCLPRLSHPPWFDHRDNTCWSVQVMKLLIMQSPPASHHFLPLRSKYSPQRPVLRQP